MASGGANTDLTDPEDESEDDVVGPSPSQTDLDESAVFDEHAWEYGMR